jgi:hypothetical protein
MSGDSNEIAPINFDDDILPRILDARKKRKGYASFFDWPNKATKEKGIVCDLLEAIVAQGEQHDIIEVKSNPDDPPDCVGVMKNGELVGFEATELVDQDTVDKNQQGGQVWKNWTPNELLAKLKEIVRNKDSKIYHGGPYSNIILVIHTDEPLLHYSSCNNLLREQNFGACRRISEVYLLYSVDPALNFCPFLSLKITKLGAGFCVETRGWRVVLVLVY